jgi:hypothetical protein
MACSNVQIIAHINKHRYALHRIANKGSSRMNEQSEQKKQFFSLFKQIVLTGEVILHRRICCSNHA